MASYKIYFLNFCYQNHSSSGLTGPWILQNASSIAVFIEKVIFTGKKNGRQHPGSRGTFQFSTGGVVSW